MTTIANLLRCLCLSAALSTVAFAAPQDQPQVPAAPEYKGEIRRGADGRLTVEKSKTANPEGTPRTAKAATMTVGPQEKIRSLSEAARKARDGEVIEILPGNYAGGSVVWTQDDLIIRGRGERPVMAGDGKGSEGKAIWVVRGGRVRIENVEFRGARVPDGNGAGIRFERGQLTVERCAFIDNEMGILTANRAEQALEVVDSEFSAAPRHDGQLHHLLYVGAIGHFTLTGSRFTQGYRGHLVKSRARENHIRYNLLFDGDNGRASYELEFPNGGLAYVVGNVIGQSATTENSTLIAYGAEGPRWPDNALYLAHNTLINDAPTGDFLKVWSEKFRDGTETWAINNLISGYGELFVPGQGRSEGNLSVARRDLLPEGGFPVRLNILSPLRGQVRIPGHARGIDLLPAAEFSFPVGHRPIRLGSKLAPGAFQ
ncbi:MAG: hypothetical protein ABI478_06415 [Propionivibrio sp.]